MNSLPLETQLRPPALPHAAVVAPPPPGDALPPQVPASSEARFRRVVEAEFDFIWRSLRGLGVPASAADDAAQHVFWIAAQKIEQIAPGAERSFLFGTAMGVAANARRAVARVREVHDDEALAARADEAPTPEQATAAKQAREVLDRILDAMPEELRTVFVLFELEGLTTAEIAELLAIPHGTAASRLRRARDEFQAATRRFQAAATPSGRRGA